uniref:Uncharacterized protein n=1 Tax=Cannabis sativa TaxID=3483 RepID=A0A803PLQ1_CANSA
MLLRLTPVVVGENGLGVYGAGEGRERDGAVVPVGDDDASRRYFVNGVRNKEIKKQKLRVEGDGVPIVVVSEVMDHDTIEGSKSIRGAECGAGPPDAMRCFPIDAQEHSGDIAMFWKDIEETIVFGYSKNHINVVVTVGGMLDNCGLFDFELSKYTFTWEHGRVQDDNGAWYTWDDGLPQLVKDYFNGLFTGSDTEWGNLLDDIQALISASQNDDLVRPVLEDEVHRSLFQMHLGKALGLDGMSLGFYKKLWHIVGANVVKLVQ